MKQKKVFLVAGPPGCGKSTWIRANLTRGCEWVSRDNVRFSIISDDEDYFSHEDDVFDTFINYINQSLDDPDIHTIFVDATHLNYRSRRKTTSRIRKENIDEINCVYFSTPKDVCHARNNLREGRAKVPASAIDSMFRAYSFPSLEEGFTHIYEVNENGVIKEVREDEEDFCDE